MNIYLPHDDDFCIAMVLHDLFNTCDEDCERDQTACARTGSQDPAKNKTDLRSARLTRPSRLAHFTVPRPPNSAHPVLHRTIVRGAHVQGACTIFVLCPEVTESAAGTGTPPTPRDRMSHGDRMRRRGGSPLGGSSGRTEAIRLTRLINILLKSRRSSSTNAPHSTSLALEALCVCRYMFESLTPDLRS